MARVPILVCLAFVATSACAIMPRELNLTPLWFHRLDENGDVLEWDCIWPVLHYERTPDGGDDFRIRPLYRRVTEPSREDAIEHQFLWPLGRVRIYPEETSARLFPLWSWRSRPNDEGTRDIDWYLLFPFVWGGDSADDREDYFALLPFYGSIPQFLTYDRFRTVLFPLYVGLDKGGHRHHLLLWPFIGFSTCAENQHSWFRIFPFYGHDVEPGMHARYFAAWPFLAWSTENEDTEFGPVHSVWIWPFFGWRTGPYTSGWMALWPLLQSTSKENHFFALTVLWPFFRYYWNRAEQNVTQWWLWPFVSRVHSDDQRTWSFAWPLVWWREYDNPDDYVTERWVLPFYWYLRRDERITSLQGGPGQHETFVKLWPFVHRASRYAPDGRQIAGDWSVLSPWPWRNGNAYGVQEAYGWLWEIARGVQRAPDDRATDVVGRLYTTRERAGETTASVPFLFNWESDRDGNRTFRLFQFLPIPLGGGDAAATSPEDR